MRLAATLVLATPIDVVGIRSPALTLVNSCVTRAAHTPSRTSTPFGINLASASFGKLRQQFHLEEIVQMFESVDPSKTRPKHYYVDRAAAIVTNTHADLHDARTLAKALEGLE